MICSAPASCWLASVSTLAKVMSGLSSDADSNTGAKLRHGPHHAAQKSTRTMPSPFTVVSKVSSVSSVVAMWGTTVATSAPFPAPGGRTVAPCCR